MDKITVDFYTSKSNYNNNHEMIRTTGKDFTSCELKAMQVNYNLYGTYILPGWLNSGVAIKYSNIKYNSKWIYYIKSKIKKYLYKKIDFIDDIIQSES